MDSCGWYLLSFLIKQHFRVLWRFLKRFMNIGGFRAKIGLFRPKIALFRALLDLFGDLKKPKWPLRIVPLQGHLELFKQSFGTPYSNHISTVFWEIESSFLYFLSLGIQWALLTHWVPFFGLQSLANSVGLVSHAEHLLIPSLGMLKYTFPLFRNASAFLFSGPFTGFCPDRVQSPSAFTGVRARVLSHAFSFFQCNAGKNGVNWHSIYFGMLRHSIGDSVNNGIVHMYLD